MVTGIVATSRGWADGGIGPVIGHCGTCVRQVSVVCEIGESVSSCFLGLFVVCVREKGR